MQKKIFFLCSVILISFISCNTTEPPPEDIRKLTLTFEDASCIEAWIDITTENLQLPATINILINDSLSQISILNTQDSLLYIDSLLPNKTYTMQASLSGIGNPVSGIQSNELSFTTMDTTSHNFTFETWTFGDVGSSVLYDVAIIDENNIWAVGEIMLADTNENGFTLYNTVHWNGNEWELKRIMFNTICGQQSSQNAYPASSIIAFSENEIWVAQKGDQIAKIENGIQTQTICMPWTFSINKIWGTSSNDLYVVGNNGNIAHYNGSQWNRLESGTELNINDIWGDYNEKTGEWEILAVASDYSSSWEKEILLIKNNQVQRLSTSSNPSMEPLLTTWFKPNKTYYVAGSGIYQKRLLQDSFWKHNLFNITTFATTSMRGNDINDVVGVGAFGDFIHFNGVGWKNDYQEPLLSNGSYTKVTIKRDLLIAIGGNQISINSEAVILIGRR